MAHDARYCLTSAIPQWRNTSSFACEQSKWAMSFVIISQAVEKTQSLCLWILENSWKWALLQYQAMVNTPMPLCLYQCLMWFLLLKAASNNHCWFCISYSTGELREHQTKIWYVTFGKMCNINCCWPNCCWIPSFLNIPIEKWCKFHICGSMKWIVAVTYRSFEIDGEAWMVGRRLWISLSVDLVNLCSRSPTASS